MKNSTTHKRIPAKKRGNTPGFLFFKWLIRLGGLKGAYGFLHFVCAYYLLFDSSAVKNALAYIRRRFPEAGALKKRWHVYRLFISQGQQLVDRYAAVANAESFTFDFVGGSSLDSVISSDKGAILLTSHVGNWQIALTTLRNMKKTVYLVIRPEDNDAVEKALKINKTDDMIKIISPQEYLGGVTSIIKALNEGSIVAIMGDRPYHFPAVEADFLGEPFRFPHGPFFIAASVGVPVVIFLAMKTGPQKYTVDISKCLYPAYDSNNKKKEQSRSFVQEYADILTDFVHRYPYQCFLFYDGWVTKGNKSIKEEGV